MRTSNWGVAGSFEAFKSKVKVLYGSFQIWQISPTYIEPLSRSKIKILGKKFLMPVENFAPQKSLTHCVCGDQAIPISTKATWYNGDASKEVSGRSWFKPHSARMYFLIYQTWLKFMLKKSLGLSIMSIQFLLIKNKQVFMYFWDKVTCTK